MEWSPGAPARRQLVLEHLQVQERGKVADAVREAFEEYYGDRWEMELKLWKAFLLENGWLIGHILEFSDDDWLVVGPESLVDCIKEALARKPIRPDWLRGGLWEDPTSSPAEANSTEGEASSTNLAQGAKPAAPGSSRVETPLTLSDGVFRPSANMMPLAVPYYVPRPTWATCRHGRMEVPDAVWFWSPLRTEEVTELYTGDEVRVLIISLGANCKDLGTLTRYAVAVADRSAFFAGSTRDSCLLEEPTYWFKAWWGGKFPWLDRYMQIGCRVCCRRTNRIYQYVDDNSMQQLKVMLNAFFADFH